MRRIRNPRYAPEFLERKLSPSDVAAVVPPPLYTTPDPGPTTDDTTDIPVDMGTDGTSIDFPPPPPPPPAGPPIPTITQ